ncbi:nuclease-related domain-containing protein [Psychrobacter sp. FDAARGOS_221]|uniref:nuclease-related domain-containing protein n=1 Tax=Psychrobacter sp. FDAARGOS_221 TaxID=1975705 RepID=UPI000BB5620B|nr:nuclease-related domain-containing protein [Psychrobacter sp. FDAARGOS_221]PNK59847.1 NERD domain-containing protein [Psychrobacter sp. FDAARGOS_221]
MSLKSTLKGMLGEAAINFTTWLMLDKQVYHRIKNVTLPLPDERTTQIDHIIVSVYGIFVVETKNYKGWIFGSENRSQWTQSL